MINKSKRPDWLGEKLYSKEIKKTYNSLRCRIAEKKNNNEKVKQLIEKKIEKTKEKSSELYSDAARILNYTHPKIAKEYYKKSIQILENENRWYRAVETAWLVGGHETAKKEYEKGIEYYLNKRDLKSAGYLAFETQNFEDAMKYFEKGFYLYQALECAKILRDYSKQSELERKRKVMGGEGLLEFRIQNLLRDAGWTDEDN